MKVGLTVLLLLDLLSAPLAAQNVVPRIPVSIRVSNHSSLNQKLHVFLEDEVEKSSRFRFATNSDTDPIIVDDADLRADSLGGKRVVVFSIRVSSGKDDYVDRMSVCYQNHMEKCVEVVMEAIERVAFMREHP